MSPSALQNRPAMHTTPWCVVCPNHGHVALRQEEHDAQARAEFEDHRCPICTASCSDFHDVEVAPGASDRITDLPMPARWYVGGEWMQPTEASTNPAFLERMATVAAAEQSKQLGWSWRLWLERVEVKPIARAPIEVNWCEAMNEEGEPVVRWAWSEIDEWPRLVVDDPALPLPDMEGAVLAMLHGATLLRSMMEERVQKFETETDSIHPGAPDVGA